MILLALAMSGAYKRNPLIFKDLISVPIIQHVRNPLQINALRAPYTMYAHILRNGLRQNHFFNPLKLRDLGASRRL